VRRCLTSCAGEINKLPAAAQTKERLVALGMSPYILTPEQMLARMKADAKRFGDVIKAANITMENRSSWSSGLRPLALLLTGKKVELYT